MKLLLTILVAMLFAFKASADELPSPLPHQCFLFRNHPAFMNDMASRAIESAGYILSGIEGIEFQNYKMKDSAWTDINTCEIWLTAEVDVSFTPKTMRECVFHRHMSKTVLYRNELEVEVNYSFGPDSTDCVFPETDL